MILAARKSVLVEGVEERIRVELLDGVYARLDPLAGQHHERAAHRRYAGGVADGLAADLAVALLVIADVIDIVVLLLTVLHTGEDAADVGLALRARAEARRIREERLQELNRHDFLTLEADRGGRQHADVLETAHVIEVALTEGHEETDALHVRQVLAEGLDLLVMQKVHVLLADLVEGILALDAHGRDLHPLAVLHVAARCRYLTEVDLRVKVSREGIAVVTAVAVEDVDGVDTVELVLRRICAVRLGYARVEAAAEECREAGVLELLLVGPLPAVIEVSGEAGFLTALFVDRAPLRIIRVLRLVVRGIHVVDAAGEAGIHDGEVLVRKGDVHHEIRLVAADQCAELLDVVGIDLCRRDLRLRRRCELLREGVTLRLGAAGNAELRKNVTHLTALGNRNTGYTTAADH